MSEWEDIKGGQETAEALKGVAGFFESMRQAFSGAGGMDAFDRQQELFGHMNELRDFSASGALERQVLLTAAREEDLSPGFFAPPASYKLQEMPQGMN
jgi:hypothetical protein